MQTRSSPKPKNNCPNYKLLNHWELTCLNYKLLKLLRNDLFEQNRTIKNNNFGKFMFDPYIQHLFQQMTKWCCIVHWSGSKSLPLVGCTVQTSLGYSVFSLSLEFKSRNKISIVKLFFANAKIMCCLSTSYESWNW